MFYIWLESGLSREMKYHVSHKAFRTLTLGFWRHGYLPQPITSLYTPALSLTNIANTNHHQEQIALGLQLVCVDDSLRLT